MNTRPLLLIALAAAACLPQTAFAADITYDADAKRLVVAGGEQDRPLTPADLAAADAKAGWGVVAYDDATHTTRVNAELVIGRGDGSTTFFQVGSAARPDETLVLRGHLRVASPAESLARSDGSPSIMNTFQLGDPANPDVHAALKFDSTPTQAYGIHMAEMVETKGGRHWRGTGSLRVFNSTITALTQDRAHGFGRSVLMGSQVYLVDSTISWCRDLVAYGINGVKDRRIEGCTFEHCGKALYNGEQRAVGCTFRHCGAAVAEGGCLDARLVRCTFEDNEQNFGKSRPGGIVLIDCKLGKQAKPLMIRRGTTYQTHMPCYPTITSLRTVVVTVVDEAGKPVPGAAVDVTCDQGDLGAAVRSFAVTGEQGATPGPRDPRERGLLLTECRLTATDVPDAPKTERFSYRAKVSAPGFPSVTAPVSDMKFKVTLKRASNKPAAPEPKAKPKQAAAPPSACPLGALAIGGIVAAVVIIAVVRRRASA